LRRPCHLRHRPGFGELAGELLLDLGDQMAVALGERVEPLDTEMLASGNS
jgi:hypothetical protein